MPMCIIYSVGWTLFWGLRTTGCRYQGGWKQFHPGKSGSRRCVWVALSCGRGRCGMVHDVDDSVSNSNDAPRVCPPALMPNTGEGDGALSRLRVVADDSRLTAYYSLCERHRVDPDPATAISFGMSASQIKMPKSFDLKHLLPFCEALVIEDKISSIDLSSCKLGPTVALAFSRVCRCNRQLSMLDLSGNLLTDAAATDISNIIAMGHVKELRIRSNRLTSAVAIAIADAIEASHNSEKGSSLTFIDVGNNNIGYDGMRRLRDVCADCDVTLQEVGVGISLQTSPTQQPEIDVLHSPVSGNFVLEEIFNALTHGIGVLWSIVAYFALVRAAKTRGLRVNVACRMYGASMFCLFLGSTLYHSFFRLGDTVNLIFMAVDHSGIFMLIAGTWTPFLLVSLADLRVASTMLLVMVWVIAVTGIGLNIFQKVNPSLRYHDILNRLRLFMFLGMGWASILVLPWLVKRIPWESVMLLAAGGVTYSVGVVFFIKGHTQYSCHVVWHLFVLFASVMHFGAVWIAIFGFSFVEQIEEMAHDIEEMALDVSSTCVSDAGFDFETCLAAASNIGT